jgi:hypothetical protein
MMTCFITMSFLYKALHVACRAFPLLSTTCAYACCSFIASTLPGCCLDGHFEDFPGEFDEF